MYNKLVIDLSSSGFIYSAERIIIFGDFLKYMTDYENRIIDLELILYGNILAENEDNTARIFRGIKYLGKNSRL